MPETFPVAYIKVKAISVVLVYVSPSVGLMSRNEQECTLAQMQSAANGVGMLGVVALVWDAGGRVGSFGPSDWAFYLRGLTLEFLLTNINKELVVGG